MVTSASKILSLNVHMSFQIESSGKLLCHYVPEINKGKMGLILF